MKTPIQELIEIFEEMNTGFEPTIDVGFAISIMKTMLEKEKEFIEDVLGVITRAHGIEQVYDWYNKNFNTEKK